MSNKSSRPALGCDVVSHLFDHVGSDILLWNNFCCLSFQQNYLACPIIAVLAVPNQKGIF